MFVSQVMKRDLVTTTKDALVEEASRLMTRYSIRHMPVVEKTPSGKQKLVGILTYSDILRSLPSPAAMLDNYESKYLYSLLKVEEILPKNQQVITIHPNDGLEEAAIMMRYYKISCLPVVDSAGSLVGIITVIDIMEAFINVMGDSSDGCRIVISFDDRPGVLADITDAIRDFHINICRMALMVNELPDKSYIILRVCTQDPEPICNAITARGYTIDSVTDLVASMKSRLR